MSHGRERCSGWPTIRAATQRVLTVRGWRNAFVLAYLNVDTRRVVLSPATFHPDTAWVTAQAESFVKQARSSGLPIRYVQRDRDRKLAAAFDAALEKARVEVVPSPARAPNTQAFVERFIGSLRSECLHHFIFFGTRLLDSVARSWLNHHHAERPHQGVDIGNERLIPAPGKNKRVASADDEPLSLRDIRCHNRLGGLLKHYERVAA